MLNCYHEFIIALHVFNLNCYTISLFSLYLHCNLWSQGKSTIKKWIFLLQVICIKLGIEFECGGYIIWLRYTFNHGLFELLPIRAYRGCITIVYSTQLVVLFFSCVSSLICFFCPCNCMCTMWLCLSLVMFNGNVELIVKVTTKSKPNTCGFKKY